MADTSAGTYNPIESVRRLKAVGIDPDHAEVITSEIIAGNGGLATKADLDAAVGTLRAEVRADLSAAVNRMMIAQFAVAGLLFAALKYFP